MFTFFNNFNTSENFIFVISNVELALSRTFSGLAVFATGGISDASFEPISVQWVLR